MEPTETLVNKHGIPLLKPSAPQRVLRIFPINLSQENYFSDGGLTSAGIGYGSYAKLNPKTLRCFKPITRLSFPEAKGSMECEILTLVACLKHIEGNEERDLLTTIFIDCVSLIRFWNGHRPETTSESLLGCVEMLREIKPRLPKVWVRRAFREVIVRHLGH